MPLPQLMPLLVAVTIARCPAPVKAQLDDLYRWQMSQQELRSSREIVSQKGRFTDGLYQKLWRAYALDPAMTPGRFLDFDPFSGTQVNTYGAKVLGCTALPGGGMEALVAVQAHLRNRLSEAPQKLRYQLVMDSAGTWKIADIVYSDHVSDPRPTESRRLTSFLAELLDSNLRKK